MHNNGPIDRTPVPPKNSYTVAEAAVLWARADGAKNAGDPRIGHYSRLITEALKSGALQNAASKGPDSIMSVDTNTKLSFPAEISLASLESWILKNHSQSALALVFSKKA